MEEQLSKVRDWCDTGVLPEAHLFFDTLVQHGVFTNSEGPLWDFKDKWPSSLSDEYFGGIARLICAFANRRGGVIVFGVHDSKRTGGHNNVGINLDRFNQAVQQLLGGLPDLVLKSYTSAEFGDVDALLVCSRRNGVAPFRFKKTIGKYPAGTIWIRSGHEVVAAAPAHFPVLFCRADQTYDSETAPERDGSIPPSPAALKRFVGRIEVLDRLFQWLENSDEPRTYLFGKGGSGKTSIAYEFARLVKNHGAALRAYGGESIEVVIFLSAKEKALVPAEGRIIDVDDPDFSNESDLLRQLLFYGGWTTDRAYLDNATIETLRTEISQYFNLTSALIILDDVDTLTTRGVDPGADFLYRTLCRSKRSSKVVYTLRNAPSQSITNSIEVPGLQGEDYKEFVSECARQFSVPQPSADFRDNKLPSISERRPLVIESIVALVRTSGSYDRAATLFSQHAGDNVREYVFIREWDALLSGNLSKLLLATLSDLNKPASFSDLQTVLQADPSRVKDVIGAVREMFLQIDEAGQEALYSLAPLTRSFVLSRKTDLAGYGVLRERIKAFKRHVQVSIPEVAAIAARVERLLPTRQTVHSVDKANEAYRLVTDRDLQPAVTEDPLFKTLLGYVCVCLPQPRLSEARESFLYTINMRFEPEYKYLRAWFNAEKNSGAHDGWCPRIADVVIDGKRYEEKDKIMMVGRKATSLYARGRDRVYTDSVEALKDLQDALTLHLRVFRLYRLATDYRGDVSETYARNTAFSLANLVRRTESPWDFLDRLIELASHRDIFLDPLEEPIKDFFGTVSKEIRRPELAHRFRGKLRGLSEAMSDGDQWLEIEASKRVIETIRSTERAMVEIGRTLRQPSAASATLSRPT